MKNILICINIFKLINILKTFSIFELFKITLLIRICSSTMSLRLRLSRSLLHFLSRTMTQKYYIKNLKMYEDKNKFLLCFLSLFLVDFCHSRKEAAKQMVVLKKKNKKTVPNGFSFLFTISNFLFLCKFTWRKRSCSSLDLSSSSIL